MLRRVDSRKVFWLAKAFGKQDQAFISGITNNPKSGENSLGFTFEVDYKATADLDLHLYTADAATAAVWKEEFIKWKDLAIEYTPQLLRDDAKLAKKVVTALKETEIEVKGPSVRVLLSIKADALEQLAKRLLGEK
jgi:hypothetical protein